MIGCPPGVWREMEKSLHITIQKQELPIFSHAMDGIFMPEDEDEPGIKRSISQSN